MAKLVAVMTKDSDFSFSNETVQMVPIHDIYDPGSTMHISGNSI